MPHPSAKWTRNSVVLAPTLGTPVGIIRKAALWKLCRTRHKFHVCALAAYLDQAAAERGKPDSEATRQRPYLYYEDALAEKNRQESKRPEPG
jgi:hypothetical protein